MQDITLSALMIALAIFVYRFEPMAAVLAPAIAWCGFYALVTISRGIWLLTRKGQRLWQR